MAFSRLAPIVESVFAYTTDVKLLEMANREQPLLRELELRAPGTYHHSMMVGHLAEKAAEAIGANALLARVGALYHDVGKLNKPEYFAENSESAKEAVVSFQTLVALPGYGPIDRRRLEADDGGLLRDGLFGRCADRPDY